MTSWIVCVVARSGSDPAALGGLIPLLQPGRDVQREAKRSFRRIAADLVRLVAASRLVRTDCKHSRITGYSETDRLPQQRELLTLTPRAPRYQICSKRGRLRQRPSPERRA